MTKSIFFTLVMIGILLITTTACSNTRTMGQQGIYTPTRITTSNPQSEYTRAVKLWQSHGFSRYEITVNVFSSLLAPPCSSKATLKVVDDKLVAVSELETPVPIQLDNGKMVFNPKCHEYEELVPPKLFALIQDLLAGRISYQWNAKYDPQYGYISELLLQTTGDSMQQITYTDFEIK